MFVQDMRRLVSDMVIRPGWCGTTTHDLDQTGLAGDVLRAPSKVAGVEAEGTVLGVTTSGSDGVNSLRRVELGHGGLTAELELSLLAADLSALILHRDPNLHSPTPSPSSISTH